MQWSGRFFDRTRKSTNKGVDCRGSSEVNAFMRSKTKFRDRTRKHHFQSLVSDVLCFFGVDFKKGILLKKKTIMLSRPGFSKRTLWTENLQSAIQQDDTAAKTWSLSIAAQFLFSKNTLEFSPFDIHKCMMTTDHFCQDFCLPRPSPISISCKKAI